MTLKQELLEKRILWLAASAEFLLDELLEAVKEYREYGIQAHLLQTPIELKPNNPTEHLLVPVDIGNIEEDEYGNVWHKDA